MLQNHMRKVGSVHALQSLAPRCVFLSRRRQQRREWRREQASSQPLSSEEEDLTIGDTSSSEDVLEVRE